MSSYVYGGITKEKRDVLDLFKKYSILNLNYHILSNELEIDLKKAAGIPVLFDFLTTLAAKRINTYDQIIGMDIGKSCNNYGAIYAYTIGMKACIPSAKIIGLDKDKEYIEGNLIKKPKRIIVIDDQIDMERRDSIPSQLEHLLLRQYNIKSLLVLVEDTKIPVRSKLEYKNIKVINLFTKQEIIDWCKKGEGP